MDHNARPQTDLHTVETPKHKPADEKSHADLRGFLN